MIKSTASAALKVVEVKGDKDEDKGIHLFPTVSIVDEESFLGPNHPKAFCDGGTNKGPVFF